ncbi:MAG TPA: diguanylate cyclase [Burkholderiales bacterium]|nr:diguanylate cyclase [Burkholderiales bacterium]
MKSLSMTPSLASRRAVTVSLAARVLDPATLVGAVILIFAVVMMAGWLLRVRAIVGMFPGDLLVFNTALCFGLIALALLCEHLAPRPRRMAGFLLGGALLLIAGTVLLRHAFGVGPALDAPELHGWYPSDNPNPGRMALMTSVGFLCIGATLILMRLDLRPALVLLLRSLALAAGFVGAVALLGHVLDLDEMFDVTLFEHVALLTGFGFILASVALWSVWNKAAWNRPLFFKSDDARLMLASALILVTIVFVSELAGFVIIEKSVDQSLSKNLLLTLKSRADLFSSRIEQYIESASTIALRPGILQSYSLLPRDPRSARGQLALRADDLLRDEGYSAVAFRDTRGLEIAKSGAFVENAPLRFELAGPQRRALMWSAGFVLRTETAVRNDAGQLGTVLSERPVLGLEKYLVEVGDLEASGEIEICAAHGAQLNCAPTRFNPSPHLAPRVLRGTRMPMSYAVDGLTGTVDTLDYDGKKIFAAYMPVGTGGLGMVVKISTVEYFRPIREQIQVLIPAIVALLGAGFLLLRARILPLARQLVIGEQRLKLALEASRLVLWDFDTRSGEIYLSEQWQAMLGGEPRATVTTLGALRALVHPEDGADLDRNLRDVLSGAASGYDIEHRVRKMDGQWLWIRSRGEVVERDGSGRALRLTGTNADIAARKEQDAQLVHQATHDALTGFPNRGLFYDRLNQAIARTRRNRSLMAVMYIDIDKFKVVNDSLGHDAGDALIKAFVQRLASSLRNTDTVARLGGDEFGVILEGLRGRDDGSRVAEKIVAAIRAPFELGRHSSSVTTSVGIAFYDGSEKTDSDRLVKMADEALYGAKGAGRNNYRVAA